jgi:hypothetical protein
MAEIGFNGVVDIKFEKGMQAETLKVLIRDMERRSQGYGNFANILITDAEPKLDKAKYVSTTKVPITQNLKILILTTIGCLGIF